MLLLRTHLVAWILVFSMAVLTALAIPPARSIDASVINGFNRTPDLFVTPPAELRGSPLLEVAPGGRAIAAWRVDHGSPFGDVIEASTFDPGAGTWTSSSQLQSFAGIVVNRPSLAVDAVGNGLLTWKVIDFVAGTETIVGNRYSVGSGSWSETTAVASGPVDSIGRSDVSLADDGSGVLVWIESGLVRAARLASGSTSWSAPVTLDDQGFLYDPLVATDSAGNHIAVWERDESQGGIRMSRLPAGSTSWSPSVRISAGGVEAAGVALAVAPSGEAVAAWTQRAPRGVEAVRLHAATGAIGQPRTLVTGVPLDVELGAVSAAVNDHGDAVVTWDRYTLGEIGVVASARSMRGSTTWQLLPPIPPVDTQPGSDASGGRVVIDDQGTATVGYRDFSDPGSSRVARLAPSRAQWSTSVRLSDADRSAFQPRVGIGAGGTVIAAWQSEGDGTNRVESAIRPSGRPAWTDQNVGQPPLGTPFVDGVAATGTPSPTYSVLSGALPAGLSLDAATGAITGTRTSLAAFDAVIAADNVEGRVTTRWTGAAVVAPPSDVDPDAPGDGSDGRLIVPVEPFRVFDSRRPDVGGGRVAAGSVTEVAVAGVGSVPAGVAAVVLNVTVVGASSAGFATVFPCGVAPPEASNLNFVVGQTVPNAVVSKVGDGGKVCVFTDAETDLLVDVNGFVPVGSSFGSVPPFRVFDSRPVGRVAAGSVTEVAVAGVGSVPAGVAAVVLNVTVVGASSAGFATVFPCGVAPPEASNLNFVVGQTVPNAVVSKVGVGGKVCVFTDAETDLLVDVNGFIP